MRFILNITSVIIFGYVTTLSAAVDSNTPILNEQQRQVYEKLKNVDTTIPSSRGIIPESNVSSERNDTICFISRSI